MNGMLMEKVKTSTDGGLVSVNTLKDELIGVKEKKQNQKNMMNEIGVLHFTTIRRNGDKPSDIVMISGKGREVEVYISPTGRAVHIWVDGQHLEARRG